MNGGAQRFSFERAAKWLLFAAVLAALAVGLAVAFRPGRMAPVSIFPEGARWKYNVPLPDRWVPIGWAWYWRGKEAIFGNSKPVSMTATLWKVPRPIESLVSNISLAQPAYTHGDGTRVWILKTGRVHHSIYRDAGATFVSQANIHSADKMAARMFTGKSVAIAGESREIGIALEVWHAYRPKGTDLKATLIATELGDPPGLSVVTNFCISGRFQIPHGSGLVLLKPGDSGNRSETIAFTLHPQWK